nr:Ig-like domain-containing protein [Marinicella sp. W31]MDC2879882.1 Ig-like domain-containing protein [Marinicella sp. W31]
MSIETGNPVVPTSITERPLPPAVKFNAATGTFTGKAEAAKTVRLTSSVDQRMHTATADANGDWTIALGKSPRWYTTFEIWVCSPEAAASSERVKFTFGGSNPRLSDVYASETLAFGCSKAGTKVVVIGPRGQVLGRGIALGKHGVWSVHFRESLSAGDRVCVLAESFSGNTSMPFFTKAEAFSVNDRNIGHIAGSGAMPGDQVQLYDTAADQVIASTIATEAGAWEVSFCDPIETGTRIGVERVHLNGTTSNGPVFVATANDCLAPAITSFSGTQIGGMADPSLLVTYTQLRNGQSIHSDTVSPRTSGFWSSDDATNYYPFDFQSGDILCAITKSPDGTQQSLVSSNVTVDSPRPGTALVTDIDENGAKGWAEPHKFIVASTAEDGVVCVAEIRFSWPLVA